jgi:aconitate hydratase
MLVVAYALAGSINIDLTKEPVGYDKENDPVYLKDIWPSAAEISAAMRKGIKTASFKKRYGDVFLGDANWRKVKATKSQTYNWPMSSTYVKNPPFFEGMTIAPQPVKDVVRARILALFGDSITTDHISPAGNIKTASPAGLYLQERQVRQEDFNSYGARRGNFELMERGTFANIRIRNEMMGGKEGGNTLYFSESTPSGEMMPIFDAAERYKTEGIDTVIIGGKEYGTGSSRDWAAKGPKLLGIRAVITESFERIHRSNLIGMGVAPFVFAEGKTRRDFGLTGREAIDIPGLSGEIKPQMKVTATVHYPDGRTAAMPLFLMILTADEVSYYKNGGILQYVLRNLVAA